MCCPRTAGTRENCSVFPLLPAVGKTVKECLIRADTQDLVQVVVTAQPAALDLAVSDYTDARYGVHLQYQV